MRYDRLGFPIPPDFERAADAPRQAERSGRRGAGAGKRLIVAAVAVGLLVPVLAGPMLLPMVREAVVVWALGRAAEREVRGDLAGAVAAMSWAIDWHGDDVDLLCLRSTLKLENRDAPGAIADADRALAVAPTNPRPARVRAIAHVVDGDPDAALADAELVIGLSARGDPEALNHRAYIRALVGRHLDEALADIDAALAGTGASDAPELLDTRGFVLHLLGRQQEAVDQLNVAIDGLQRRRRELAMLAGRMDAVELARRRRWLDHSLAVMFHHRGLACRALGLDGQADQDREAALKKGFDPTRGIF